MPDKPKVQRCAIYTRVSTDAGLNQEFNSLDAQREAAEAFIKSQTHEGWLLVPTAYDDGGFSGGTLERPALQQLLAAIRGGEIDIVVVYKVDRLTRSLADFAKVVELFDKSNVSFVSVTQAFNTTNSMGRLTLNVLLSFAQFEREVTTERIRDKVAASKKKGVWMGGTVPFGYRVEGRKLFIVQEEAAIVRLIFDRYLKVGSVVALVADLRKRGVRTRLRKVAGKPSGGVYYKAGPVTYLLKNRIYVGDIVHKDRFYPGEHPLILDRDVFQAVQDQLAKNIRSGGYRAGRSHAPLLGKIFDDNGNLMTPRHSQKGSRRYYYYTSRAFIEGRKDEAGAVPRVAANDIEPKIIAALAATAGAFDAASASTAESRRLLLDKWVEKVIVHSRHLDLHLKEMPSTGISRLEIPWRKRLSKIRRDAVQAASPEAVNLPPRAGNRKHLLFSIARSRHWLAQLVSGSVDSIESIAENENLSARSVHMTIGLAFLAPEIVTAILEGRLQRGLGVCNLSKMPPIWSEQKQLAML